MSISITEPGIFDGIPDKLYHSDLVPEGSLSVSGAKLLLAPSTPAHFKHRLENPLHKDAFDFGAAAHSLVLEDDTSKLEIVKADNWLTKDAKTQKDEAYKAGKTPLLEKEFAQVEAMALVIKRHPIAGKLFSGGKAEQSAFVKDQQSGVWLRGRFDYLPTIDTSRRLIIPDYKSAVSADPNKFAKSAADFRYHMQDPWYRDLIKALGLHDDIAFVFVVQEKTAPYAVNVIELDSTAVRIGRELNRRAIETYAHCVETNHWPDYQGVTLTSLPIWAENEAERILDNAA